MKTVFRFSCFLIVCIIVISFSGCKKNDDVDALKQQVSELQSQLDEQNTEIVTEEVTHVENVTNSNGETVTEKSGEPATKIVKEVVTKIVEVTTSEKKNDGTVVTTKKSTTVQTTKPSVNTTDNKTTTTTKSTTVTTTAWHNDYTSRLISDTLAYAKTKNIDMIYYSDVPASCTMKSLNYTGFGSGASLRDVKIDRENLYSYDYYLGLCKQNVDNILGNGAETAKKYGPYCLKITTSQGKYATIEFYRYYTEIMVPNLVGMTQAEAESTLSGLGFTYRINTMESSEPSGTVLAYTPTGKVAPTDWINVTVAK